MKKLNLFVFTLIAIFGFGIVNVNAATDGFFTYDENPDGTTVTISDYSSQGPKDVVIPDKLGGKTVTTIGMYAFAIKQLTSVTIPSSVTTIGDKAFCMNQLTSVTIPSSVTTIGKSAFFQNKLTHVTIPNSVTIIDENSFSENQLTEIVIPESVLTIGLRAFEDNNLLTKAVILNDSNSMIIGDRDYDVFRGVSADFKLYGYANSSASTYATASTTPFVELKKITSSMIGDIATQYYKGSAVTPTVKVNDGTKDLELDTDYEVSYKNNDKVGTATVTITGKGDYEYFEVSKTFTIAKQQYSVSINPLTGATITPSDTIKVDFDGSQNYTIEASDGYEITSVLVNGVEKLSTLVSNVLTIANPTENTTISVVTEAIKYKFTEGKDAEYNGADLTFKLDGLLELLDRVYVNGKELSSDNYTTESGSTIITIKDEYLKTLGTGTYDLRVTYTNGAEDTTTFKINDKVVTSTNEENPKTSDGVLFYVGLGLISLIGLTGTGLYIKKRFN